MTQDDRSTPLSELTIGWPGPAVGHAPSDVLLGIGRRFVWQLGSVLVAAVAGCWSNGAGFVLFMMGMIVVPIATIGNAVVGASQLWHALGGRTGQAARLSATVAVSVAVLGSIIVVIPALRLGTWLGDETLLIAYHSHYRAIISAVQRSTPDQPVNGTWHHDGAVTYVVDAGEPRRVAFEPAGMLDNWSGIVWDPSHEVMKANGFDPRTGRFRALERVTKLFGGDLVGCRRLGGDWFECTFT